MRPFAAIAAVVLLAAPILAETPPGLRMLADNPLIESPDRNWRSLGIGTWEIRKLNRVYNKEGVVAWNVGYKSDGLGIAGFLAQPIVEYEEVGGEQTPTATFPVVILCHGSSRGVTPAYREIALELARRGYVVAASTYRGQRGLAGHSEGKREYAGGETLDVLQLAQLVRKLDYVDSLRMAIWGQAEGGSIAAQIIGRSNIFRAAVVVAPALFASTSDYRYAGMRRLASLTAQISGREMSSGEMIRGLRKRDAFYNIAKIDTPTLVIAPGTDPGGQELAMWVDALGRHGVEHRLLPYPNMFTDFMTAADNGLRPPSWDASRAAAWANTFNWIESYVPPHPGPPPE